MVATPTRRGTGARERRPSNEVHRLVGVTLRFCGAIAVVMLLWLGQMSQPGKVLADTPEDWMPDATLRAAVRQELNVPEGVVLQRRDMQQITDLTISSMAITDLTGLEHATGLTTLVALDNQISDLRPLASLERLRFLDLGGNQIEDVSPLEGLHNLEVLRLWGNRIRDVSPLATLTQLKELWLNDNRISSFSALEDLPLQVLNTGEQTCDISRPQSMARVKNRSYPSAFAAWHLVTNLPAATEVEKLAKHDLYFSDPQFGLYFVEDDSGFHIAGDIEQAIVQRDDLLAQNPNIITLVVVQYYSGVSPDRYPEDWPLWLRDDEDNRIIDIWGEALLDFTLPETQAWLFAQAEAVFDCGLYDGIFLDHWSEDLRLHEYRSLREELEARDRILAGIREIAGDDFLILVNSNHDKIPRWSEYVNGLFMETLPDLGIGFGTIGDLSEFESRGYSSSLLAELEETLLWAETHLQVPRINALEGRALTAEAEDSPRNRQWMRLFTTMSLTLSDGYSVLAEGSPHHYHYWYDFWEADLGQQVGAKGQRYQGEDGIFVREFTNGWAVYNRSGDSRGIEFPERVSGVTSGVQNQRWHALADLDGEIYLKSSGGPADIDGGDFF